MCHDCGFLLKKTNWFQNKNLIFSIINLISNFYILSLVAGESMKFSNIKPLSNSIKLQLLIELVLMNGIISNA